MRRDAVLLVVDIQNDFLPGGALAVDRGDEVIPVINRIATRFDNVLLSQDWHPPGHISFASSHRGQVPFSTIELPYGHQVLVPRASLSQAAAVVEGLKSDVGYAGMVTDDAVAKVSIVGVGIRSNPELAAKMFAVLAERQINLAAVSSSEIKVSALIAEDQLDLGVRVLHSAFGLDEERAA